MSRDRHNMQRKITDPISWNQSPAPHLHRLVNWTLISSRKISYYLPDLETANTCKWCNLSAARQTCRRPVAVLRGKQRFSIWGLREKREKQTHVTDKLLFCGVSFFTEADVRWFWGCNGDPIVAAWLPELRSEGHREWNHFCVTSINNISASRILSLLRNI